MKLHRDVLSRFVALPPAIATAPRGLRDLLDDLGIEVKRADGPLLTLELLANRGDHHCYAGVAREIAARFGTALTLPEGPEPEAVPGTWFRVESPLCLAYSLTEIAGAGGALPPDVALPLDAAGLGRNTAAVDATNLANLEIGQPTHAFDADRITGTVVVRESRPGERAWLLFTAEPRELPAGTLVITDDDKVLAVAGVIGCEESKTTAETTRIWLESGTFDPVAVRKASRALDVRTDSAARFERGADVDAVLSGAGRVTTLLESTGSWRRTGPAHHWRAPLPAVPPIGLLAEEVRTFLGLALDDARIGVILEALGFGLQPTAGGWWVSVPERRRWDVASTADLYEEIARIAGYDQGPAALPPVGLGAVPAAWELRRVRAEEVLLGHGFHECITDGFHSRILSERLGLPGAHPLGVHVETTNALDRGYSLLKNSGFAQAVDAVAGNVRARSLEVKLYEWTRAFHPRAPDAPERNGATERPILWAVASGSERPPSWAGRPRAADVPWLRGVVRELGIALHAPLTTGALDPAHPLAAVLHPHRAEAVRLDGAVVGAYGEVHPRVLSAFKLKGVRPVYLELDADPLLRAAARRPAFVEPPTWHPIERSVAFTLPRRFPSARVDAVLAAHAPPWLERSWIADRYEHDGGAVTLTWNLRYANPDNTRTVDEVNSATEGLIAAVLDALGPDGLVLR